MPGELRGRREEIFHQATGLFADNQFSKAIPLLRQAATLAPKEPVIHRYLGYALWKEDHLKETAHELEEALHLHSKDVFTLYFLADGRFSLTGFGERASLARSGVRGTFGPR